ncbi:MAG: glycosyltransferase family 4 protein [Patescibacteria group bacterium]
MNICYLIDVSPERFTGGGQTHLLNLIKQMKFQISNFKFQILAGLGPNVFLRLLWMLYVIPQVIFQHLFKQRFDLIHAHSIPAMVSGKILSVILGIPVVVTVHGYNGKRWMEKLVLTKIKYDAQITVSRNFLEIKNINKNVVYIPNGIDIVKFILRSRTPLCRAKLHHSNQPPQILFVGRKNDPVKGFSILETALELVKKEIPQTELLVAGGDLPSEDVLQMYRKADLFVLPSLSEGFPLTLLEAWAAKLPVVVTAVGDIPYLFKLGSFVNFPVNEDVCETSLGYVIRPGSSQSLARGIIMAFNNNHLAKLGENGYNLVKEYSWEKTARETVKVYQKICLRY